MASFEDGCFATEPYDRWLYQWRSGADDWSSGELDWRSNVDFDKWHYPYSCGICKRGENCDVNLSRCKNCKIAYYCCREHQMKAWPNHKKACKHFATALTDGNVDVNDAKTWKTHIMLNLNLMSRCVVPNPLKIRMNEDEWIYQRHCQVCFYNPAGVFSEILEEKQLVQCKICHCAAHCSSPECAAAFTTNHTSEACENYMIGFAAIVMAMQQGNLLVINSLTKERVLSLPANWAEYFDHKIGDFEVHEALLRMPPVMAMLTDGLSFALTILHSLQQAYGVETLSTMERVEVHVLGAEVAETTIGETKYEEILHWLPACKELVIVLVSTKFFMEMKDDKTFDLSVVPPNSVCQSCSQSGAKMWIRPVHGLYHTVASLPTHDESDHKQLILDHTVSLVIACHSGMHDVNFTSSWEPTVKLLSQTDIPCVFTGYNARESAEDREKLAQFGANITSEPRVNPFRGLRPFPEIGEDNKFYYTNHSYIMTRGASYRANNAGTRAVQDVSQLEVTDQDERVMELLSEKFGL